MKNIKGMKMEFSPEEQANGYNCNQDNIKMNTDEPEDNKSSELSQLELIKQWRCNLNSLLEELGISNCNDINSVERQDIAPEIVDKLTYLKETDELLKQHDDFALSLVGFEKYKDANLSVMNSLTQVLLQKQAQNAEIEKECAAVKFYFFSRAKHTQQQTKTIPWSFAFFHLILLVIATVALAIGAVLLIKLTQQNGIVKGLLLVTFLAIISMANKLRKHYRKTALTSVRFTTSLISICSLTTVLYALIFIAVPALCVWEIKPFWRDDVLIIGLGLFAFIMLSHGQENEDDVSKLADAEVIK